MNTLDEMIEAARAIRYALAKGETITGEVFDFVSRHPDYTDVLWDILSLDFVGHVRFVCLRLDGLYVVRKGEPAWEMLCPLWLTEIEAMRLQASWETWVDAKPTGYGPGFLDVKAKEGILYHPHLFPVEHGYCILSADRLSPAFERDCVRLYVSEDNPWFNGFEGEFLAHESGLLQWSLWDGEKISHDDITMFSPALSTRAWAFPAALHVMESLGRMREASQEESGTFEVTGDEVPVLNVSATLDNHFLRVLVSEDRIPARRNEIEVTANIGLDTGLWSWIGWDQYPSLNNNVLRTREGCNFGLKYQAKVQGLSCDHLVYEAHHSQFRGVYGHLSTTPGFEDAWKVVSQKDEWILTQEIRGETWDSMTT